MASTARRGWTQRRKERVSRIMEATMNFEIEFEEVKPTASGRVRPLWVFVLALAGAVSLLVIVLGTSYF
jgi:hypothetical protein